MKRPAQPNGSAFTIFAACLLLLIWAPGPAAASPPEVLKVVFEKSGEEWRVSVTLAHADSGWKHYADRWVIESLEGKELARRVLAHPHVEEQPFTRSASVRLPAGLNRVRVRAGDNLGGLDSNIVTVVLTQQRGERFEVR